MNQSSFQFRHGQLLDIIGRPIRQGEVTYVPANVELHGSSFDFSHALETYASQCSLATRSIVKPGEDSPWVLGRLINLFNVNLAAEEFRLEKSCFFASFMAVLHTQDNLAIPFCCCDYYFKSSLLFSSDDPPDASIQSPIARSFWELLLSSPLDTTDYESRMYHSGAGVWIQFGVEAGESYMIESEQ